MQKSGNFTEKSIFLYKKWTQPFYTSKKSKEVFHMFGLGVPELVLILVIGLVIFGPGKLPGVGKALGKSLREFKDAVHEPAEAKAEIQEAAAEAVKPAAAEHHGK